MTADVHVDRLVLDLPGLSQAEARELAAMVGEGLSSAGPIRLDRLSIQIERSPGEPTNRLAARIVAQLLRQIG